MKVIWIGQKMTSNCDVEFLRSMVRDVVECEDYIVKHSSSLLPSFFITNRKSRWVDLGFFELKDNTGATCSQVALYADLRQEHEPIRIVYDNVGCPSHDFRRYGEGAAGDANSLRLGLIKIVKDVIETKEFRQRELATERQSEREKEDGILVLREAVFNYNRKARDKIVLLDENGNHLDFVGFVGSSKIVRTSDGLELQVYLSGSMGFSFAGRMLDFSSPDLLADWMNKNPPPSCF